MKRIIKFIIVGILLICCGIPLYYLGRDIDVENHQTIEERAYDAAVSVCEKDVLNSVDPIFEDYDPKYIRWVDEELIEVKVVYHTYYNNVKKEVKYRVNVYIDDGACYPDVPERMLD